MKIYLVGAYCGSHSTEDYREWIVRGFFNEDNAVEEVNKLNQQIADIKPIYKQFLVDLAAYDKFSYDDFDKECQKLYQKVDDPFLVEEDDIDTRYYYFAVEAN